MTGATLVSKAHSFHMALPCAMAENGPQGVPTSYRWPATACPVMNYRHFPLVLIRFASPMHLDPPRECDGWDKERL